MRPKKMPRWNEMYLVFLSRQEERWTLTLRSGALFGGSRKGGLVAVTLTPTYHAYTRGWRCARH